MSSIRVQLWINEGYRDLFEDLASYHGRQRAERLRQLAMLGLHFARENEHPHDVVNNQPTAPSADSPAQNWPNRSPSEPQEAKADSGAYSAEAARNRASRLKGSF